MILAATPIGSGCRVEGPHGPDACGGDTKDPDVLDGSCCSCGCSAFEDYCAVYLEWYAAAHPPLVSKRTQDSTVWRQTEEETA